MQITHFKDPILFQERALPYLVRHEAENNLLLGILASIIAGEYQDISPYMALAQEGKQIRAAALCTPPHPVLLSYEKPAPDRTLLEALLKDIRDQLRDKFCGLAGNRAFVSPLIGIWEKATGKKAVLEFAQRIYKLERVLPVSGVPGEGRWAGEKDRALLLKWYEGFYRDAMLEPPDPKRASRGVEITLSADPGLRRILLWEVEGRPVSMAGYAGPTPSGMRVGPVYTPQEHRRQGYASACTAAVSQHLLDQGKRFCFLFTDLENPTSNHIYQQIGYQPVCDVDRYLI